MKIAYVLDSFPVLSETFILREILELRRKGFDIPIFALKDPGNGRNETTTHPEADALRNEVRYLKEMRKAYHVRTLAWLHARFFFRNPVRYVRLYLMCRRSDKRSLHLFRHSVYYARLFEREGVDHIHSHFALHACTLAMLVSAWTRIRFSFTIHAHDIFMPGLAALMNEKLSCASFVVSISEYNKQYLLSRYGGLDERAVEIVRCGVDLTHFVPSGGENGKAFTILSVGRLHPQKGMKYLVGACELLKKLYGLEFSCQIVGDGEERELLESQIREAQLEREVSLLGAADQHAVRRALEKADVFVLPCVATDSGAMDGIPVALMEAMAMGVPVISTRISGIPELVGRGAGIVVDPENVGALCDATLELAALTHAERRSLGMRGRAVIEQSFNLHGEVEKLSRLFTGRRPRYGQRFGRHPSAATLGITSLYSMLEASSIAEYSRMLVLMIA